jgi:hypothetical protein
MQTQRKIAPVVKRGKLKEMENDDNDLEYWLSKTPKERVQAITLLVLNSIPSGTKMDRTHIVRRKMKEDGSC